MTLAITPLRALRHSGGFLGCASWLHSAFVKNVSVDNDIGLPNDGKRFPSDGRCIAGRRRNIPREGGV